MGAGAILEPLIVIVLLFGGTWINRTAGFSPTSRRARCKSPNRHRGASPDSLETGLSSPSSKDGLLKDWALSPSSPPFILETWRKRRIGLFWWSCEVASPNTAILQDRLLSRLLRKLPFLAECWYWALVYWVGSLSFGST